MLPVLTETGTSEAAAPVVPRLRRWPAPLFLLAGLGLLPWTVYLVVTLPGRHLQTGYYDVAWGGFDVGLATLLAYDAEESAARSASPIAVCRKSKPCASARTGTTR